jgi:hypothetical protein
MVVGCSNVEVDYESGYLDQEEDTVVDSNDIDVENYSTCSFVTAVPLPDGSVFYFEDFSACGNLNDNLTARLNDPRPVEDVVNEDIITEDVNLVTNKANY